MVYYNKYFLGLLMAGIVIIFPLIATADTQPPEITSQGFLATQAQRGLVGKYPRLRIRVEAPQRLESLIVQERSYEVDLATTRDKKNLYLFGLEQSPRSSSDVTLNLQKYINEKISSRGVYTFNFFVKDTDGNTINKNIYIEIIDIIPNKDNYVERKKITLEVKPLLLRRVGKSNVRGGDIFGIAWKNVNSSNFYIKLYSEKNNTVTFSEFDSKDFYLIHTVDELLKKIKNKEKNDTINLMISEKKDVNKVFSIQNGNKIYLVKIDEISICLSDLGTEVKLVGYYKNY